jgi:hypothetical protein
MQTARAAVRLVLTLEAWKLEHGKLPETLDELLPKPHDGRITPHDWLAWPYLHELPVDPYSGVPFQYFRNGIESPLCWGQPWMANWPYQQCRQTLAANRPFIWSTGTEVYGNSWPAGTEHGGVFDTYNIRIRYPYVGSPCRSSRPPKSEHEIWESGWPFPIP